MIWSIPKFNSHCCFSWQPPSEKKIWQTRPWTTQISKQRPQPDTSWKSLKQIKHENARKTKALVQSLDWSNLTKRSALTSPKKGVIFHVENQAKSLTPRQSNFLAVHLFSAFCFFLFVVCALLCIACRSPALSFIGRRRVDPRKACHLGEISGKNSPGCLAQNFHLPSSWHFARVDNTDLQTATPARHFLEKS